MWNKLIGVIAVALGLVLLVPSADAATVIGRAVADTSGGATVGSTVFRPALGAPAIEYYIPLGGSPGTYGVGEFGTSSDTGFGGGVLTMFLEFAGVDTTNPSTLEIFFEDLDLIGASDPPGFLESIDILYGDGSSSLSGGPITDIASLLVSGDANTQQLLSLPLATLLVNPFYLQLKFAATSTFNGTNTPEYLIAQITAVPIPAALPLFGTGLGILGFLGWRRRRKRVQAV